jgi:hypothetical protein
MRYIFRIILILLFLTGYSAYSQELLIPVVNTQAANQKTSQAGKTDTLSLPFYDDFSYTGPQPDSALWADKDVYVNAYFAENPPTWGMATLDAVDKNGAFYAEADYNESHVADRLTSNPINLDFPDDNSVYLSFFFSSQGLGDYPDIQDSLILEFLDVENQVWKQVWYSEGMIADDFQFVIIPVDEDIYLKKGFRFRFKNYVSLGSEMHADLAINVDYWHIDMVYLDRNRTSSDNVFKDLAITSPISSLLSPYSAMPYSHFIVNPEKHLAPAVQLSYKNNDNTLRLIDSLKLTVADYPDYNQIQTVNAGSYNVPANARSSVNIPADFSFSDTGSDRLMLETEARIVTATFDPERNNSIKRYHELDDYYAYDDGTAEAGYGLYGSGTKYGRVAYKFYTETPANISAVQMHFNRSLNDEGRDYFFLNVWKQAENGLPETEPVVSLEGVRPEYYDALNTFHTFEIEEPVFVEDTFYIGWTQTQAEMLNVGFDLNTVSNQYLYFNISGAWEPSQVEGTLMMRPVMKNGQKEDSASDTKKRMTLSPNPARNYLTVSFPDTNNEIIRYYEVYTVSGQMLIQKKFDKDYIDISSLGRGIFFLKAYTEKGGVYTEKFVVIR